MYRLFAIDAYTNTSNAGVSVTINIDTVAPESPTLTASKPSLNGSSIDLSWNVPTDTVRFVLQQNDTIISSNISASQTSLTLTGLSDGSYVFRLFAINASTNTSNAGVSATLNIDTLAPEAPEISASISDGNDIDITWSTPSDTSHFVLVENGVTSDAELNTDTTSRQRLNMKNGVYRFGIYAIDAYGNTSALGLSHSVTINVALPEKPSLSSFYTSGNKIFMEWPNPTSDTFDSVTIVRKLGTYPTHVNDGDIVAENTTDLSYESNELEEDLYYFSFFSKDIYGNYTSPVTLNVFVDLTPPQPASNLHVTLLGHRPYITWVNPTHDVRSMLMTRGTSGYPTKDGLRLGDVNHRNVDHYNEESLSEGTYYYSLFTVDSNYNYSTPVTFSVFIDRTAPSSPILTTTKNVRNGNRIHLDWTVPSGTSRFLLKENGTLISRNISASTNSFLRSGLSDGSYTYTLYAIDAYQNTSNVSTSTPLVIDTTAPASPTVMADRLRTPGSIAIDWNVPYTTHHLILKQNGTVLLSNMHSTKTAHVVSDLSDGTYLFSVEAVDAYGNTSNAGVSGPVVIDLTAPSSPILTATKNVRNGNRIHLDWSSLLERLDSYSKKTEH